MQKANFGGVARQEAVGFSIGSKGYIGTGWNGGCLQDFWEWDPSTNIWTQKANFGGGNRQGAYHFSIGTKGYIGMGWDCNTEINDFWEWDQATNLWTQKANYPGTSMQDGSSFSIGTKGYIGTGYHASINTSYNVFWEWDQATNIWTQMTSFGGMARIGTTLRFSIGTKGYIGLGTNTSFNTFYNDFWEWDPSTNVWTQKANFGGTARCYPSGFSICTKAYIGTGYDGTTYQQDFWEWDQTTNIWTQVANFGGAGRYAAIGFSIGNKGYAGTGSAGSFNGSFMKDFWEFTPSFSAFAVINSSATSICSGQPVTLTGNGGTNYSWNTGASSSVITVSPTSSTTYSLTVNDACESDTISVAIIVNQIPNAFVSGNTVICEGENTILSAGGGSDYSWNTGSTKNPLIVAPSTATSYTVIVSNLCGSDTDSIHVSVNDCYCPDIFIPNAFSLNGDNENDTLFVQGTKCVKTFSLVIYNRWGEKVFETNDIAKGWDGIYNGKKENSAVFVYSLEATLTSGSVIKKKGNISLVR